METFISGYCRALDDSRMVCVEQEDGQLLEADCAYPNCPFSAECTIARGIQDFLNGN